MKSHDDVIAYGFQLFSGSAQKQFHNSSINSIIHLDSLYTIDILYIKTQ